MIRIDYVDRAGRVTLGRYAEWTDALKHVGNLLWTPEFITVRKRGESVVVTVS